MDDGLPQRLASEECRGKPHMIIRILRVTIFFELGDFILESRNFEVLISILHPLPKQLAIKLGKSDKFWDISQKFKKVANDFDLRCWNLKFFNFGWSFATDSDWGLPWENDDY